MCILGEPTEGKVVLGHFGSLWLRIGDAGQLHPHRLLRGQASTSTRSCACTRCMAAVLEWIPTWEADPENAYRGESAIVNVGAIAGGFGWRVSRTPHHTDLFLDVRVPPTKPMARRARPGARHGARSAPALPGLRRRRRGLRDRARAPRSTRGTRSIAAIDASHAEVFGAVPGARRDALVLGRLGADALRRADGQLRHIDGPDGHLQGREPDDRRSRHRPPRSTHARRCASADRTETAREACDL